MSSGHPLAGGVPEGNVIVGLKVMDAFPLDAVIESVLPDSDAVREEGGPGSSPPS